VARHSSRAPFVLVLLAAPIVACSTTAQAPRPDAPLPPYDVAEVATADHRSPGETAIIDHEILAETVFTEVADTGPEPDLDIPSSLCVTDDDCPAMTPYCLKSSGQCAECLQSPQCKDPARPLCHPDRKRCVDCVEDIHCQGPQEECIDNLCLEIKCSPEATVCVGNAVHMCAPDGTDPDWHIIDCGEKTCLDGTCVWCLPDTVFCKGDKVVQCLPNGSNWSVLEVCESQVGCAGGQCCDCYPGKRRCTDGWVEECQLDCSTWQAVEDCDEQLLNCVGGLCLDPCTNDVKSDTNAGCVFYAVDLDNAFEPPYDAQNAQFAVIASNPSTSLSVDVFVHGPLGEEESATVAPRSLYKFELPATWGLDGTQHNNHLFKVTSSGPIIAYQFNPLSNEDQVFSNDASVLLPAPTLGKEYYVVSYNQLNAQFRSYFTIVAAANDPTEVTFTVTTKTLAGDGIPALNAGESHTLTLAPGELVNIESDLPDGDLTGSHIKASHRVAVFGGHEAANMHGACCADHLEQQLVPVAAWGTQYLVSRSWPRLKESDYVRVVAAHDDTQVSLTPGVDAVPLLAAGEHYTFKTTEHVFVTADHPILVTQYLASSQEVLIGSDKLKCANFLDCPTNFSCSWFSGICDGPNCATDADCPSGTACVGGIFGGSCEAIGDPAMMLTVPKEQFVESYVFLVPDAYVYDYLNIVAPVGATIYLDDTPIPPVDFDIVGLSELAVYQTKLEDGVHTAWSIEKFGIMVHGYDNDVSYGYPGGLGLADLSQE
jgi:hypothetical protein